MLLDNVGELDGNVLALVWVVPMIVEFFGDDMVVLDGSPLGISPVGSSDGVSQSDPLLAWCIERMLVLSERGGLERLIGVYQQR